jgi:hypothetical protein
MVYGVGRGHGDRDAPGLSAVLSVFTVVLAVYIVSDALSRAVTVGRVLSHLPVPLGTVPALRHPLVPPADALRRPPGHRRRRATRPRLARTSAWAPLPRRRLGGLIFASAELFGTSRDQLFVQLLDIRSERRRSGSHAHKSDEPTDGRGRPGERCAICLLHTAVDI